MIVFSFSLLPYNHTFSKRIDSYEYAIANIMSTISI